MECFQSSLAAGRPNSDTHLEMALLCERRNQLEQAAHHVHARLRLKPADDEGRLVQGRLLRRGGELTAAEKLLRDVAARRSAHWMTRMRACYELATVCDQRAAYDSAWSAMLAAKSIARQHGQEARRHRDAVVPPLARLAQQVSAEHFQRWRSAAHDAPQPTALLTGLPRSGTSLLERILAAHSQIDTADEWDAFPRLIFPALLGHVPLQRADVQWLESLDDMRLAGKRRTYLRFLAAALGRLPNDRGCATQPGLEPRTLVDKNPSLLPLLPVYQRLLPQGKLIIALRDPRDALSA
jgi:hypothetical protein